MRGARLVGGVLLWAWAAGLAGGAEPPAWLKAVAREPTPDYAAGAPAVVLRDDTTLELDASGTLVETHRFALRVLHEAGRKFAEGQAFYNGAADRVVTAGAWVLRDGKPVTDRRSIEWVDVSAEAAGAVIDEMRLRHISLSDRALVADVFGYEIQVSGPLTVAQCYFEFGGSLPIVNSSYTLAAPEGFRIEDRRYGPVAPETTGAGGNRMTWRVERRPYRPEEPSDADAGRIDARVLAQVVPADAAGKKFRPTRFQSWSEVTAMCTTLNAPQCDANPALVNRVHGLVAGAADTLERVRRIGGSVQKLRYIAINRGLRYGYGWRARKATEVLGTGFGDCKDKANLMVAMLREAGVTAYLVIARLDGDRPVEPDFPTPIQFNHAIVAIPVAEDVRLPAVTGVEGLGRVLFFDPTDAYTLVGDLSRSLQGSRALVVAPGVSGLTTLPVFTPVDGFALTRRADLELAANGDLLVRAEVAGSRQAGATLRRLLHDADEPREMDELISGQLSVRLRGAAIVEKHAADDPAADRCALSFTCFQRGFMQLSASNTPVLKLDVLGRAHLPALTEPQRRLPVELDPVDIADELKLTLPAGYVAAELPPPVSVQSEYGKLAIEYQAAAPGVVMKRRLELQRRLVPVDEYPRLRQFLADIAKAERNAIMLRRVSPAAASGGN